MPLFVDKAFNADIDDLLSRMHKTGKVDAGRHKFFCHGFHIIVRTFTIRAVITAAATGNAFIF